jgi:photosystem II stability/assembly factor-like uncharacterized protein
MKTVKDYYQKQSLTGRMSKQAIDRELKHWQRYEWYMSSRLGPNGELVNINQKLTEATGLQPDRTGGLLNRENITESNTATWAAVGPLNTENGIGRADRIAFHPTNPNTIYIGTPAGGLWRTTDAGANWTNLSANISSAGISGILIDPVNPSTMYILTGDGDSRSGGGLVQKYGYSRLSIGVLKSTDGGVHWNKTGDFPDVNYSSLVGFRLVMHPADNNIIYACTNQGLFWSLNGGDGWALINGGGLFYNMKFQPGSSTVCYAVSRNPGSAGWRSFWRSTSSGFIWDSTNAINQQINNPSRRVELAVAPSNPSRVYLLAGGVPGNGPANPVPNLFKGVYLSTNAGVSFSLQSNSPNILGRSSTGTDTVDQSNYDLAIAVSNTNSTNVIAGGVQAWYSTNSGVTWSYRGAGLHDDVHDLAYNPLDNKLWAATDGGVYSSTDNGANWTSHFEDMNTTQFYRMAVNPSDYLFMIAGAQDNAVKRRSAGSYFDEIACCDGFAVGYDPLNSSTVFAVTNQQVNRSTDGGDNFDNINPANTTHPFSMAMAVHTSLSDALFIGSDSLWRTTNGGANWSVSGSLFSGWFIRTCPSNGNRVYAAGGTAYDDVTGFLFRSDNGGASWPAANILSSKPTFPNSYTKITSINVRPTNSAQVWVTFGGFTDGLKVYYSPDAGETWVNRSGSLPNVPVNCMAIDSDNNAYAGTDNGVYYRAVGSSDWVPFYNNLPYVPVTDLIITESENRIRAATFGRGIWSSETYSTCPINLNVTGTLEGQEFHEASNSVTSNAGILTSEGSKIQMRGGFEVLLQAGFTARENTQFRALIGPCGSGNVVWFRQVNDSTKLAPEPCMKSGTKRKALVHINPGQGLSDLIISVKEPGQIAFVLTDAEGNRVESWNPVFLSSGRNQKNLSLRTPLSKKGLYYLHLVHNGEWQHLQEFEVK